MDVVKAYYRLTKPGIIYGNAVTAVGGFLLASQGHVNAGLFFALLFGISLVIGSACVFNNYIDRDIDRLMKRTKGRALVSGAISGRDALIFATALVMVGSLLLGLYVNHLTLGIGLFGFFAYVVLYGVGKRRTVHGTVIGSISGAVPLVAGYCAVTNRLDLGALLLFAVMVFWQMPHFYAIAVYRMKDYAAASIPVLPIVKGLHQTKVQMLLYIIGFIIATSLLTVFGYTGYTYLVVMVLVGLWWLRLSLRGFKTSNDDRWARRLFGFSLIVVLTFSAMISLDVVLP
jgi:protoheme IX farnesyltransferase